MKILFISIFFFTASALASSELAVFPYVYNYGSRAEVQVWNHTDRSFICSGWVNFQLESGRTESDYYFEVVPPRFNSFKSVYPRSLQDRIRYVIHGIFCH